MTLLVVLVCLATYRTTRLLVEDTFPPIASLRDRLGERWGPTSALTYLINCAWCVSVYVAAVITLGADRLLTNGIAAPILVWLTASAVTGLIASFEPIR